MKILFFLLITCNVYSYMSKSERYPRQYTEYEKEKFAETALRGNSSSKWRLTNKCIETAFIFAGTPKEKLYMKKSLEQINKIFKITKSPLMRIIIEKNTHDYLPTWIGEPLKKGIALLEKNIPLTLNVTPNIREWHYITELGGTGDLRFEGVIHASCHTYANILKEEDKLSFYKESFLEHKRIHTFVHELFHGLGFQHIKGIRSVINSLTSEFFIRAHYIYGHHETDTIFLEMKYNKLFEADEEENFFEKLNSNKLRRPDRRSRKEKILYPVKD